VTPSPHTTPRKINHAYAVASASDDFDTEVKAFYEAANTDRDHLEMEALARITVAYARNVEALLSRMEYARDDDRNHGFIDYLTDTISDQMQHGGGAVVVAHVRKILEETK
jgi:hypothetical protein